MTTKMNLKETVAYLNERGYRTSVEEVKAYAGCYFIHAEGVVSFTVTHDEERGNSKRFIDLKIRKAEQ